MTNNNPKKKDAKPKLIEPRVLKGFRDLLPAAAIPRQEMIRTLEDLFSSFGFCPIDTPALEYSEVLLGKGGLETDKQLFRFNDQGGRDIALRFDLTVPLARFVSANLNDLPLPFKRYHIAPVWRAEKPQRGRYREFVQCDFDIIGTDSVLADAEIGSIIHFGLERLGIRHTIRVNNRRVLNAVLGGIGAAEHQTAVLRAIDKLDKQGEDAVAEELAREAKLSPKQVQTLFQIFSLSRETGVTPQQLLQGLCDAIPKLSDDSNSREALAQLERTVMALLAGGIVERCLQIDLTLARGLDYYTGTVFEARSADLPEIGSIAGGGRYDDLTGLYCSRRLPGVGASIGLDRVLAVIEELKPDKTKPALADVLVTLLDQSSEQYAVATAASLRQNGVRTELSLEHSKLGNQFKMAERKGIRFAILAGEKELGSNSVCLKDLVTGDQREGLTASEAASLILNQRRS